MTLAPWQIILGFLATVGAAWITAKYASRASVRVAEVNVEQGAFVRAEGIYKNAISRLEQELQAEREARQRLAAEFKAAREEWASERTKLEARIQTLEQAGPSAAATA